jgi:hypothetical protein
LFGFVVAVNVSAPNVAESPEKRETRLGKKRMLALKVFYLHFLGFSFVRTQTRAEKSGDSAQED